MGNNNGVLDLDQFLELRRSISVAIGIPEHELDKRYADTQCISPLSTGLTLIRASKVAEHGVVWVWPGLIPVGKVTLIVGDPGLGKSLLTTMMAAKVSTGGAWPVFGGGAPCGDAIILSGEDDPNDTIVPRLRTAGADRDRVHILSPVVNTDDGSKLFSISENMPALEAALNIWAQNW